MKKRTFLNLLHGQRLKLLAYLIGIVILIPSCDTDDDNPTDPEPTFADPTIAITAPENLTDIEVEVSNSVSFTIDVVAEAGLSELKLNDDVLKTYANGETEDSYTHSYSPAEIGTKSFIFTVEDAQGKTATSLTLEVVAIVGVFNYTLIDFGGDEVSNVLLSSIVPSAGDPDRTVTTFNVVGNFIETATFENLENQFTINTGIENPDASADILYEGKTMKISKAQATWNNEGWGHIMIDFGMTLEQSLVEELPKMNDTKDGLTAGTKYIELDVYYQDSESLPFEQIVGDNLEGSAWGSDRSLGYSFMLYLTNHETQRLNHDGGGMYIAYREYLTEPNKWVTLRYDNDSFYLENAGNNYGSDNENVAGPDEINGIKIIAGGGYMDGQSENEIYFRNLRIVE